MSLIAEARNEILGWDEEGPPQYVQLRPEVAEALLDAAEEAITHAQATRCDDPTCACNTEPLAGAVDALTREEDA